MGFAIGTGTDLAIEATDVTLMKGSLQGVVTAGRASAEKLSVSRGSCLGMRRWKRRVLAPRTVDFRADCVIAGRAHRFGSWIAAVTAWLGIASRGRGTTTGR